MFEMTLYGRGGQGGVTLAKLIATAYFRRGKWSQAFGVYAAERSGAPIQAYVRVDDGEITNHNQVREPDHVIVLDPTLIGPHILAGLKPEGSILLNTSRPSIEWTDLFPGRYVATVDATAIAVANGLGTRAVPIVNTTMMGAIAKVFGLSFEEVEATFEELNFGGANLRAARQAYDSVNKAWVAGTAVAAPAAAPLPPLRGLVEENSGAPPAIKTGSWATRRPVRRELTPPCNHNCPAGNDVQAFLEAASRGSYTEALEILLETSPLPGVCGRVCPAPCMESCNRKEFDEGVNVRELERYVADHGEWPIGTEPWGHDRVAVVGSGPAGLSAAYQLAKLEYGVTLFEGSDQLGGVLRNGIPEYRLPKEVLDRELGFILEHGVAVYLNTFVDKSTLLRLTQQFSAVFVATGLQHVRGLNLGHSLGDVVMQGIEFLDRVHRQDVTVRNERIVVVGGGNTAIDAARSSLRLGAAEVRIVYRRSRSEMPAIAEEIDAAIEEGATLDELLLPIKFQNGFLVCARMQLGEPDASGRREPVKVPDSEFIIPCDRIILALGQSADLSILEEGAEIHDQGQLLGVAGSPIFIGGDAGTNAGTVAAAIGSGRRAAVRIHEMITGEILTPVTPPRVAASGDLHFNLFDHAKRNSGGALPVDTRRRTFREVHYGFDDHAAAAEAQRCLSCGVCNDCESCINHCPEGILERDGEGYRFNYDYCKGCGICSTECPRGVVIMSEL